MICCRYAGDVTFVLHIRSRNGMKMPQRLENFKAKNLSENG
jgi:hypothetical protein